MDEATANIDIKTDAPIQVLKTTESDSESKSASSGLEEVRSISYFVLSFVPSTKIIDPLSLEI